MVKLEFEVKSCLFHFCRYKGVYDHLATKDVDVGAYVGLNVLVDGTVPMGKSRQSILKVLSILSKLHLYLC